MLLISLYIYNQCIITIDNTVCIDADTVVVTNVLHSKVPVVVLSEFTNLLQLHMQSTTIMWVGLSPASSIYDYTTILNDVDITIITTEILYEEHFNSSRL